MLARERADELDEREQAFDRVMGRLSKIAVDQTESILRRLEETE